MNRIVSWLAAIAIPVALAFASGAQANESTIKRAIEERLDGVKVQSVTRTPYAGMWEVRTTDNEIFYTDQRVSFIFVGSVRDGKDPQRNLTEERLQRLTAVKFETLPFDQSFKIVRGAGRRQIAYFSDPNCPYCRQVEREFQQMDDVTIHVFMYPILSAESAPRTRAVWCATDRTKAWQDLMLNGVQPPAARDSCDAPIQKNVELGKKIRIQSVPTLLFPNGVRISGYRPAAELIKAFEQPPVPTADGRS